MLRFVKYENNQLLFGEEISDVCSACGKPMLKSYKNIPHEVMYQAKEHGIVKECWRESGVCTNCFTSGGFQRRCDCCGHKKSFPNQFQYELVTRYAKYPDDDTDYEYVCSDCVSNNQDMVIKMLANSEDISDIRKEA